MNDLKIVYLKPEELTPYERNTRRHTQTDIDQIKTSILRCGFEDPIGVWGPENIVVEGHGRLIAAKELHLDKVPCLQLDHMTDAQRREYGIRHNRTQELSSWDFDKLDEEIAALMIAGVVVWIRQKTPVLFLSGFLMFLFSALGPATGNFDLIFYISMFGEVLMALFFLVYSRFREKRKTDHK